MTNKQQISFHHQAAAAMNDLARRHYAQTISRASNLSHLQLLNRCHQQQQQQQQQQLCCQPANFNASPLSPVGQQQQQKYATYHHDRRRHPQHQRASLLSQIERQAQLNKPLCRCRVMYLGSSVPHITKNGLHGIQEPLRHLYPDEQFNRTTRAPAQSSAERMASTTTTIDISHLSSDLGIDSWLSVWSNGLLLENVDEFGREIKRFFSIESLHYCAAVRFFDASSLINQPAAAAAAAEEELEQSGETETTITETSDQNNNNNNSNDQAELSSMDAKEQQPPLPAPPMKQQQALKRVVRFLPLDAPLFQCPGMLDTKHPPMFSAIMRRTSGIKVLECHAFICRRDAAANALVRCCTHAYADLLSARRMSSSGSASQFVDLQQFGHQSIGGARLFSSSAADPVSLLAGRGRHQQDGSKSRQQQAAAVDVTCDGSGSGSGSSSHRRRRRRSNERSRNNKFSNSHESLTSADERAPSSLCDNQATNSSGDDNYAIISRHQSRANSRTGPSGTSTGSATLAGRPLRMSSSSAAAAAAKLHSKRAAVGSSKSLFDDFMPSTASSNSKTTGDSDETLKLMSHSMDLLQLQHRHDDGGCTAACYESSAAATRTKRHSKSMQNLVQAELTGAHRRASSFSSSRASVASGCASQAADTRTTRRRRHRLQRTPAKRSLQEIPRNHSPSPPPPAADALRGERLPASDEQQQQQAIYDKPNSTNYYERIEEQKSGATKKRDRSRAKSLQRTHRGAGSSSAQTNSRQQPPAAMCTFVPDQPAMLYAAPSLGQQFPVGQLAPPPLLPVSMAMPALYPGHASMQPMEAAFYANTLLKCPPAGYCLPPAPAPVGLDFHMSPAYAAAATAAGQQQQRHLANALAAHYANQRPFNEALATLSHRKRKQSAKSSGASLATRFRCLSPPLNFISGLSASSSSSSAAAAAAAADRSRPQPQPSARSTICPRFASQPAEDELTQTKSTPKGLEQNRGGSVRAANELDVVSAKPGFISHSLAGQAANPAAATNGKRLSWIKRLSLTMGGSHYSPISRPDLAAATRTTDDEQANTKQQKKRSSRLFAASLSLGRTSRGKQQQPALVTQQS